MKHQLAARCVDVPLDQVHHLEDLYEHDREITFTTFARHVDWQPLAQQMGYATRPGERGLRLSQDRCVRFYRSMWQGQTCYHMDQSAVDFVFTLTDNPVRPAHAWH